MKLLKSVLSAAALTGALLGSAGASAAYLPSGVLNDVSVSDVSSWGWTQINESNYGGGVSIADLFAGHGNYVMIGAMHKDSGVIDVLAGALYSDVTTFTARNQTHAANGVEWYFNGLSMGFAGAGDTIYQNTADTEGYSERDRLSWHTSQNVDNWNQDVDHPDYVFDGWRSGNNVNIYQGTDWVRVVFTADALGVSVPEPMPVILFGLGLLGLVASRRRA